MEFSDGKKMAWDALNLKEWFKKAPTTVQVEVMLLPEDFIPALVDLAKWPEKLEDGTEITKLIAIPHGNFGMMPMFEIKKADGAIYTYEFHIWRQGAVSGAKGLVVLTNGYRVTHVVVLKALKFAAAPSGKVTDIHGGFKLDGKVDEKTTNTIIRELTEEGWTGLKIGEIVSLGHVAPDYGQTANRPEFFLAYVSGNVGKEKKNADIYELASGNQVIPIEKFDDFVAADDCGFLMIAYAKAKAKHLLP